MCPLTSRTPAADGCEEARRATSAHRTASLLLSPLQVRQLGPCLGRTHAAILTCNWMNNKGRLSHKWSSYNRAGSSYNAT